MVKRLKVGFIGLGLMGLPMASNLIKKGFEVYVFNRTISKSKPLEDQGARVLLSPADLASEVDVLITMVTGPEDVEAVLFGENGVIEGNKKDLVVIDMSTIGPTKAREIGKKLKNSGVEFLDAPVTGSTTRAKSGELTIFVGGEGEVLEKVKPILLAMGKDILHIGGVGSGQSIKLINNLIVAISNLALAEGFLLGDIQGLMRRKVAQNLENVPALSPFMKMRLPKFVSEDYSVMFSISNMDKDLKLALAEVKKAGINLPVLKVVESLYAKAKADPKIRDKDISAVIKIIKPYQVCEKV